MCSVTSSAKSENSCMNCTKKKYSLLDELSYQELETLERNRSVINYKKGEIIYKEGTKPTGLLCLNEGKVKLIRSISRNNEQIVGLKKPVDFIDVRALMRESLYQNSAKALEDSSVCFIEKDDFYAVVKNNSNLSLKIIRLFADELDKADNRLITMTQKHLHARLAEAILHLLEIYGTMDDEQTINCILKRSDLAGLSNMTTANVIRTLSFFSKEGVIESEKKRIKVKDLKKLMVISSIS